MTQQALALDAVTIDAPSGAEVSGCGRYRYLLWRRWDKALPDAVFCMLNPSQADWLANDPTIRKCIGFANRWQCGGIVVVNLFAYRSTDPAGLRTADRPIGERNDDVLRTTFRDRAESGLPIVVAWGAHKHPMLKARALFVRELAAEYDVKLVSLHRAADGSPRHPLMLAYSTPLEPWP